MAYNPSHDPRKLATANRPQYPRPALTVNEVAQLAAAGVKIEMVDVEIITAQEAKKRNVMFDSSHLTQPLLDRLIRQGRRDSNEFVPLNLSAVEHGGVVYVFFYNGAGAPLVLEDQSNLYPSDALMAKIALYQETHRQSPFAAWHDGDTAPTQVAMAQAKQFINKVLAPK